MEGGFISKLECGVKREKRSRNYSSSDDDQENSKQGIIPLKDNKLELAKAEMGEVKEENQRLKKHLAQIMEEYKNLHKKFRDAVDHQQELQGNESASTLTTTHQEHDLVSLCLGRTAPASSFNKNEKNQNISNPNKEELALGLDCKFDVSSRILQQAAESPKMVSSADNSFEEVIREEKSLPGKVLKKDKSIGDDHEAPQQNAVKKTRVSVRARCNTPTMNDGCQWRKYGQKISKGNPCPRAYYRCTVSTTCPVRKQVQRCAQDMTILITTYEGTHNHLLSMSATAMASTTSAAASMLMSGSSTSGSSNPNNPSSITTPAELRGLNFYFSDGSKPSPYYPQNPSPSCPTITLDLTSNTISSSPILNRSIPSNFQPKYSNSTTNLNFGSWTNMNGALIYGTNSQQAYIKNNQIGFGRHPQENVYQSYMQKSNLPSTQQSLQANTIEAATKAITSDPNFQSALQAALSSIISSSSTGDGSGRGGDDKYGHNLKLDEGIFPHLSNFPSNSYANILNKSTLTEDVMILPPPNSSSLSSAKRKSTSPDDSLDHVK